MTDERFEVELTLAFETEGDADQALAILNRADSLNIDVALQSGALIVFGKPVEWRSS